MSYTQLIYLLLDDTTNLFDPESTKSYISKQQTDLPSFLSRHDTPVILQDSFV